MSNDSIFFHFGSTWIICFFHPVLSHLVWACYSQIKKGPEGRRLKDQKLGETVSQREQSPHCATDPIGKMSKHWATAPAKSLKDGPEVQLHILQGFNMFPSCKLNSLKSSQLGVLMVLPESTWCDQPCGVIVSSQELRWSSNPGPKLPHRKWQRLTDHFQTSQVASRPSTVFFPKGLITEDPNTCPWPRSCRRPI